MTVDAAPVAAAERRYLTIVFIDLVGYTGLSERLDPEDLRTFQRRYQVLTTTVMEKFGGFVAQFTGDGVLVYFGYPRSRGKDTDRAFLAALELLKRLPELDASIGSQSLGPFNVRIGIHTGLVLVASEIMHGGGAALLATGEAVNVAARLQADARIGGILASSESVALVGDRFETRGLGSREIRGLTRRMEVFEIIAARATALMGTETRVLTTMLGRDPLLARLQDCWHDVETSGTSRIAMVTGDAGVGKTRLASEFWIRLDAAKVSLLQTSCSEIFSSTALYAVTTMLSSLAGFGATDDDSAQRAKLDMLLDETAIADPADRQLVASLLGLAVAASDGPTPTPQLQRLRQMDIVVALVGRELARRSTVLWIEDVHWIDPSSAEVLGQIVSLFGNSPLLILLTRRSFPVGQPLPAADVTIELDFLDIAVCTEIARSIAGAETLSPALLDSAAEAAEGIPLFVEQLTIALIEESHDLAVGARKIGRVPLLLADMMAERLDRRPGGRAVLQTAACIGRSFTSAFLAPLVELSEARMTYILEDLVAAELLVCNRRGDDEVFEFRHSLIQRIANESMVREQRQETHDRIVSQLRRETGDSLGSAQLVAYHLTEAGHHEQAVAAWINAGAMAARKSAHFEAVELLRRGLALTSRLPDVAVAQRLEIQLQTVLMGSLIASEGATAPAVLECCERGLALCCSADAQHMALPFAFGQFTYTNCRGDWRAAAAMAKLFLNLAERSQNLSGQVVGHRLQGTVFLGQGDASAACTALETSLRLYVPERDDAMTQMFGQSTEIHTRSSLSLARFCLGEVDTALAIGIDALRSADRLRHPHSTAIPMTYVGGWVFGLAEAVGPHEQQAMALLDLADQHRLSAFRAHALGHIGWAKCRRGAVSEGAEHLQMAVEGLEALGFQLSLAGYRAIHASALCRLGLLPAARREIDRAGDELAASSFSWFQPEQLRIAANIAAAEAPGNPDKSTELLRQAGQCAANLGFPFFERRCLLNLAAVLGANRVDEATKLKLAETQYFAMLPDKVAAALGSSQAKLYGL